ncbi:MAG: alpha/beta hydrolase [Allosphingosinicella sp.]
MPAPANSAEPPPPPGRVVRLAASDGVPLVGSYWPGARRDAPAVLLLHGVNSSRASLARHAIWLNRPGYAVLAIDLRGHGGSAAVSRSFGLLEARAAAAALAFIRSDAPPRRVGLIGTSLGGAAALLGGDGPLPVQAMVLQAVYPDLRSAIANRIAQRLGRPLASLGEPLLSYQPGCATVCRLTGSRHSSPSGTIAVRCSSLAAWPTAARRQPRLAGSIWRCRGPGRSCCSRASTMPAPVPSGTPTIVAAFAPSSRATWANRAPRMRDP